MFNLAIRTNNAAFHDNPYEVADLLDDIAQDVREGRTGSKIFDHNGNHVGNWKLND